MKRIALAIILLLLLINVPCYAINLDSENVLDNIMKSFDEEREQWIIRSNKILYMSGIIDKDLRNKSYPEVDDNCLVEISHSIFRGEEGYIIIDKPINMRIEGKEFNRFAKKIRLMIYEELHNRYNIRMPKENLHNIKIPKEKQKKSQPSITKKLTNFNKL